MRSLPLLLLSFLLLACDGDPAAPGNEDRKYDGMLLGGDVSALTRIEDWGANFFDADGDPVGALQAMVDGGANTFRLRIFVDPNGSDVVVNDLAYTIALAQRVKATGARLLLDFHYSDTWADPGKQFIPAAWSSTDVDTLESQVEAYTEGVIAAMDAAGVLPDIVQIGNEIDGGLLWPLGKIGWEGFTDPIHYERFGRLVKAGIRGVENATDQSDSVAIMIHYSGGGNTGGTRWFFDHVQAQGIEYDLIGLSYYPFWHGTLAQLGANLEATALRYGKPIVVVETAYPWRADWSPGAGAPTGWNSWGQTPAGQAAFLRALLDTVLETPNGLGAGVIWWYPEAVQVAGHTIWGNGALALFGASNRLLPAGEVF
jgi:arabinogalactan endo-1,4-beta-galactosidase